MFIRKVIIKNYKCFRDFKLELTSPLTIIVGDNETGKSTLLEAINLCLTGQINGRSAIYELSPYWFNKEVRDVFIKSLKEGKKVAPPSIIIELYLDNNPDYAHLRGSINSLREDAAGLSIRIEYDESYSVEYEEYIKKPDKIRQVPIEYYRLYWFSFAYDSITKRNTKLNVSYIDASSIRLFSGSDYYVQQFIEDTLTPKEKAELSLSFRMLKESFATENSLQKINSKLKAEKGRLSDKEFQVSIDTSQKANWMTSLTSYLDDIPFQYIGKGDQSILKMLIALDRNIEESHVILIEEPENNLSFSNMSYLINRIKEKCAKKQLLLTTHSTFVLNKLGINSVVMFGQKNKITQLTKLSDDTKDYFMKLPGYDTLRLILAKRAILVEGASDELFIQKAYLLQYTKLPIEEGVDIISIKSLSFKRFLEISILLDKQVTVVTDNDGDYEKNIIKKYEGFMGQKNIRICYDKDNSCKTMESQVVKVNELSTLNAIFERNEKSKEALERFMIANKTDCALRMFNTEIEFIVPSYIKDAIKI